MGFIDTQTGICTLSACVVLGKALGGRMFQEAGDPVAR